MHSTDNLEDGYIGSGKRLWYSINKYGKENHTCEILEFLESRELLKEKEKQLVNQDLLNDSMCMNLAIGGEGGHGSKFLTKEQLAKGGKNSMAIIKLLRETDPEYAKINSKSISKSYYKAIEEGRRIPKAWGNWTGRKHKLETIEKLKGHSHQVGLNNSQYGKCWITNGIESQKIYKGDSIPEGWKLGRKQILKQNKNN
jgi:hypothetical protein